MLWPEHSYRQVLLHKIFRAESDRTRNGSREPNSICPTIAIRERMGGIIIRSSAVIHCRHREKTTASDSSSSSGYYSRRQIMMMRTASGWTERKKKSPFPGTAKRGNNLNPLLRCVQFASDRPPAKCAQINCRVGQ